MTRQEMVALQPRDDSGIFHPQIDITNYQRITLEQMNDNGADNLVQAVVDQAVKDYVSGRRSEIATKRSNVLRVDAQRFFSGAWFETLTGCDGTYFLRRLEAIVCKRERFLRTSARRSDSCG